MVRHVGLQVSQACHTTCGNCSARNRKVPFPLPGGIARDTPELPFETRRRNTQKRVRVTLPGRHHAEQRRALQRGPGTPVIHRLAHALQQVEVRIGLQPCPRKNPRRIG